MKKLIAHLGIFTILLIGYTPTNAQWTLVGEPIFGDEAGEHSGAKVSINDAGDIIAVSSMDYDGSGNNTGRTRVFKNISNTWQQLGSDIIGEYDGDKEGYYSISLNADGTIIALGAVENDCNGTSSGQVRVFHFSNEEWVQLGNDLEGENAYDYFGSSVSLSADGFTLAVGIKFYENSGQVKVFELENGGWILKGSPINGTLTNGQFGGGVDISADGNVIAIADDGTTSTNQTLIYEYTGSDWTQKGNTIEERAYTIALNEEGSIAAIDISGKINVYEYIAGNWTMLGSSITGDSYSDGVGHSVDINNDGHTIILGAELNDDTGNNAGEIKIFTYNGSSWIQIGDDINGENEDDSFGGTVCINGDGSIIAAGTMYYSTDITDCGAVYIFENSSVNIKKITRHAAEFSAFPSPAKDFLQINLNNNASLISIEVRDITGSLLDKFSVSIDKLRLPMNKYAPGIYILNISKDNEIIHTMKILKN